MSHPQPRYNKSGIQVTKEITWGATEADDPLKLFIMGEDGKFEMNTTLDTFYLSAGCTFPHETIWGGSLTSFTIDVVSTPEPGTIFLLFSGVLLLFKRNNN